MKRATAVSRTDNYYADGQLSDRMSIGSGSEAFYWDGLALLRRDDTNLTNEPAVTGGNPIMADGKVLFNDMLGSTMGTLDKGKYTASNLNLFGNKLDNKAVDKYTYFTGKPHVQGLGYSFLFRNYREDLAKWQTQDPMGLVLTEPGYINNDASLADRLGYPDGWNNLAYGNNQVVNGIDYQGTGWILVSDSGYPADSGPFVKIAEGFGADGLKWERWERTLYSNYQWSGTPNTVIYSPPSAATSPSPGDTMTVNIYATRTETLISELRKKTGTVITRTVTNNVPYTRVMQYQYE